MKQDRLNRLEQSVLMEIAKRFPEAELALIQQFAACRVSNRENTGAGFFTTLVVDRLNAAAVSSPRTIGNVWADLAGFSQQMTFVLFMEDGYCKALEGASIDDDTSKVDFDSVTFTVFTLEN